MEKQKQRLEWIAYSNLVKFKNNLSVYIEDVNLKNHKRTEIKKLYRELSEIKCRLLDFEKKLKIEVKGDFEKTNLYKHQNWDKSKIPTKVSQLKLITVEE